MSLAFGHWDDDNDDIYNQGIGISSSYKEDLGDYNSSKSTIKQPDYKQCVDDIKTWATSMVNCSHIMCSMSEANYEKIFGKRILDIINKHIK